MPPAAEDVDVVVDSQVVVVIVVVSSVVRVSARDLDEEDQEEDGEGVDEVG
jgi:hypothetical protein